MFHFASIPKFCISLKNSKRRLYVQDEFKKAEIHNVAWFDAIDKHTLTVPELSPKIKIDGAIAPGILACMLSHLALIRKAKEMNLPSIVVFEDDVIFCDDFQERIAYLENNVPDNWDIITLGGHFQKPDRNMEPLDSDARRVDNYIHKVYHQGGTYAYIIRESVYDYILRNCNYNFGMDQFYSDHVYSRFNTYAFVPFLVGCAEGRSEITDTAHIYENIKWFYQQQSIGLELQPKINNSVPVIEKPKRITQQIDLTDCTFITAVRIDSKDREFNFLRVIQYLCDHFCTTIRIKEQAQVSRVVELLPMIDRKECEIIFDFEQSNDPAFHRTRLLNEMLFATQTECVINYDIDCLMEPKAYVEARNKVLTEGYDMYFPFKYGGDVQKQVFVPQHVKDNYSGESLFNPEWCKPHGTYCGHCQFFRTDSYIEGGAENEEFIAYGPEDRCRVERFQKLGYKVGWGGYEIYHIEHSRDDNSSAHNPHFANNERLLEKSRSMSATELAEYYKNMPYLKKYVKH